MTDCAWLDELITAGKVVGRRAWCAAAQSTPNGAGHRSRRVECVLLDETQVATSLQISGIGGQLIPVLHADQLRRLGQADALGKQDQRLARLGCGWSYEAVQPQLVGHGADLLTLPVGVLIPGRGLEHVYWQLSLHAAERCSQVKHLMDADGAGHLDSRRDGSRLVVLHWVNQVSVGLDHYGAAWLTKVENREAIRGAPPAEGSPSLEGIAGVSRRQVPVPRAFDRRRGHVGDPGCQRVHRLHTSRDPAGLGEDDIDVAAQQEVYRSLHLQISVT